MDNIHEVAGLTGLLMWVTVGISMSLAWMLYGYDRDATMAVYGPPSILATILTVIWGFTDPEVLDFLVGYLTWP